MYNIAIPETVHHLNRVFYLLGFWKAKDEITLRQLIYFIYFVTLIISIFLEACTSIDSDDVVFLTVTTLIGVGQICRMYCIFRKQNEIVNLIHETGVHRTTDFEVFSRVDKKLKHMMTFAKLFILMIIFSVLQVVALPVFTSRKRLIFDIAFPLAYKTSQSAFGWLMHLLLWDSFCQQFAVSLS